VAKVAPGAASRASSFMIDADHGSGFFSGAKPSR
jgi:hypothetical protein